MDTSERIKVAREILLQGLELDTEDEEAAIASLRSAGTRFVSSGSVSFPERELGFKRGFVVRTQPVTPLVLFSTD